MQEQDIMRELIRYAYEKMEKQKAYPFCAFIVKKGVIISKGYNSRINLYGDKTTHGEMDALTKANKSLLQKRLVILGKDYELYSTCEPCLACFDTALWADVKKFVFSVDHNDFPHYFHDHPYNIEDYEKDNQGEIIVKRNVLHAEGLALFKKAQQNYGW
ncbi:MAG: deaminase [Candidatus Roizmanbacteria bacterium]|nr:deaminase [Candidatus Roizmanbacteria bacterium]